MGYAPKRSREIDLWVSTPLMSRKIYPPYPRKGSGGCNYVDSGVLDTCEYVTHPGTSQKVVAFYQTNGGEKIFEKNQMLGLVIAILRFYPGWQVRTTLPKWP